MKTAHVLRYAAIGMATLGLGMGIAAASSVTLDQTGPDSHNDVTLHDSNDLTVKNTNKLNVDNDTHQEAESGNAKVHENTTGGDATSGDTSNDSTVSTDVTVDNGSSCTCVGNFFGDGSGDTVDFTKTGPDSHNTVHINHDNDLKVTNWNDVKVDNNTHQEASSGNATVSDNTTGGNATSGSASNTSSTSSTVSISN